MMPEQDRLEIYEEDMRSGLAGILNYWARNMPDDEHGGFIGRIDGSNVKFPRADKGSVLNARILWTFSAAFNFLANDLGAAYPGRNGRATATQQSFDSTRCLEMAYRAYSFTRDHFIDKQYGGVYWSVDHLGKPADTKKQIYAQAFAIYALAEYYKCTRLPDALSAATNLFHLIEKNSFDQVNGGYIDAFAQNWEPLADLRLSEKDANEKKTMNTHLHLVEAYTNLYQVWPDNHLRSRINSLLNYFLDFIIDPHNGHLGLFFDEQWQKKSTIVSYGHDIEAAWLLLEAAELTGDDVLIAAMKKTAVGLASVAARGIGSDQGLWYERNGDHIVREKHWWPQAEAMVGFFNAWQISGDLSFFERSFGTWQFTKKFLVDETGEWCWGVDEDHQPMTDQDKAGPWKCPYHNSRACLEIIQRINSIKNGTKKWKA